MGEIKSKNIDEILKKKLPENSWLIEGDYKSLKKLNSYNSIVSDLNYVKNCISELEILNILEKNNHIKIKSLLFSSVTTYIRCFNERKKEGRHKFDISTIKKYFPKGEKINTDGMLYFHNYLFNLRNKFIGHADFNKFEKESVFIEFSFDFNEGFLHSDFKTISASMFSFDKIQLNNFSVLTEYMLIVAEEEIKKSINKLQKEIGDSKLQEIGLKILNKN